MRSCTPKTLLSTLQGATTDADHVEEVLNSSEHNGVGFIRTMPDVVRPETTWSVNFELQNLRIFANLTHPIPNILEGGQVP